MPFTDSTEYPTGIFRTLVLTDSAQVVGVAGENVKVAHFFAKGGGAAEVIIFRASGGGAEYFQLSLAINERVVVARGFHANGGGLEVLTTNTAGDVQLIIFFHGG